MRYDWPQSGDWREPQSADGEVEGYDVLAEEGLAEVAVHDQVGDHDGADDGDAGGGEVF